MSLYSIRNFIIDALLIIVAFVVQTTLFTRIPLIGVAPDILLIITFIYGYKNGKISGMIIGLFSGLLIDVYFCDVIGYHALVLLVIGYVSGMWNTWFYSDDLYVPLLLLSGSDVFYGLIYFFVWYVLQARFELGYYAFHVMLPEFLLTFITGVILYKPITALIDKQNALPD